MTLVVELEKNLAYTSMAELNNLLPAPESELIIGDHTFRYYQTDKINDDTLIITVMKIPGVLSAYFKPAGAPPG